MTDDDELTPACALCGQHHIGTGDTAVICLQGTWHYSPTYEAPMFVLNPDVVMTIVELPNGQLALVTDVENSTHMQHMHDSCLDQLANEVFFDDEEDEDEEDEELEL